MELDNGEAMTDLDTLEQFSHDMQMTTQQVTWLESEIPPEMPDITERSSAMSDLLIELQDADNFLMSLLEDVPKERSRH